MSMCRVFSCAVGRGCLLWPVHSLGRTLLAFALLHSVFQGQICLLLQVFLDFLLLHSSPLYWRGHLSEVLVLKVLVGKPLWYSSLENPNDSMKRQNDRILKDELPRSVRAQYATGDQCRNNSRKNERIETKQKQYQLWMWLMIEARSDAVKSNTAMECGMLGPWIKANWKWSNKRWQEWTF